MSKTINKTEILYLSFFAVSMPALVSGRLTAGVFLLLGSLLMLLRTRSFLNVPARFSDFAFHVKAISLALLAAWAISTAQSYDFPRSFEALARMVAFVVIAIALYDNLSRDALRVDFFLRVFLVSSLALSVVAMIGIAFVPEIIGLLKLKPIEYIHIARGELKSYSSLAGLLVFFAPWAGMRLGSGWKIAGFLVAGLSFAIVILTKSDSAIAGILAGLCVLVGSSLFSVSGRMRLLSVLGLGALVALGGEFIYAKLTAEIAVEQKKQIEALHLFAPHWLIDAHRQIIWRHVLDLALERPWLGWGINTINFVDMSERQAQVVITGLSPYNAHPHNWVLEVLSETGILGFLALVAAIGALFLNAFVEFIRSKRGVWLALMVVSASFWGSSLFNHSFWSAWWQISYLLILATLYAAAWQEAGSEA